MNASEPFVRVCLVWDDSDLQVGLRKTLRVCGTPAVLILDSNGRFVENLASTRPEDVEAQLQRIGNSSSRADALRALPDSPGTPWDWIRERVAELGSDDFEVRARASEELARLQGALRTAVEEASRSGDAEVRARAEELKSAEDPPKRTASGPISLDTVVEWLEKGVKPYWVRRQIQKRGATFSLTDEDVARLRRAGASDDLIDTMREAPVDGK